MGESLNRNEQKKVTEEHIQCDFSYTKFKTMQNKTRYYLGIQACGKINEEQENDKSLRRRSEKRLARGTGDLKENGIAHFATLGGGGVFHNSLCCYSSCCHHTCINCIYSIFHKAMILRSTTVQKPKLWVLYLNLAPC